MTMMMQQKSSTVCISQKEMYTTARTSSPLNASSINVSQYYLARLNSFYLKFMCVGGNLLEMSFNSNMRYVNPCLSSLS